MLNEAYKARGAKYKAIVKSLSKESRRLLNKVCDECKVWNEAVMLRVDANTLEWASGRQVNRLFSNDSVKALLKAGLVTARKVAGNVGCLKITELGTYVNGHNY